MKKTKKVVKKKKPASAKSSGVAKKEKFTGKITHYFSNIEVAVIDLTDILKDGDSIRVVGGEETDFKQKVKSMQIDYKKVKLAKKGNSVGIKIKEKVREGYKIFKI
jgi:putative protease